MTLLEAIEELRKTIVETLVLVKGLSLRDIQEMTITELTLWRSKGLEVYKNMNGLK